MMRLGAGHASAWMVLCQTVCCVLGAQPNGLDQEAEHSVDAPAAAAHEAMRPTPAVPRAPRASPPAIPIAGLA